MRASNRCCAISASAWSSASKGRFAVPSREGTGRKARTAARVRHQQEEFLAFDARRCGRFRPSGRGACKPRHRFPVELPARFIHLLTYVDEVVLDPFLGSGAPRLRRCAMDAATGLRLDQLRAIAEGAHRRARASLATDASPPTAPTEGASGRVGPAYHPTVARVRLRRRFGGEAFSPAIIRLARSERA